MEAKITKILVDDNNKEYKINDEIVFDYLKNNKKYKCFGTIIDIQENYFIIEDATIDLWDVVDNIKIWFTEVINGSIRIPDNDWY